MAWILVTQNQQVRERKLIAAAVSPLSCLHPWPRPLMTSMTTHWSHNTDDFTSHTQLRLRPIMLQMLQTLSLLDKVQ